MRDWRDAPVRRHDVVTIPIVWLAALLSLIVHVAMLWFFLPRIPTPHLSLDEDKPGEARRVLVTRLAPTPRPEQSSPAAPPPQATPEPQTTPQLQATPPPPRRAPARPQAPRTPAPTPPPPPRTLPPVVTPNPTVPVTPPTPTPTPPPPTPAPAPAPAAPPPTDLASYIEARRRARGEVAPSTSAGNAPNAPRAETDIERRDRIVAANLAPTSPPTFGYDPKSGGGVFQIKNIGYDDAEFWFTGFNKDIARKAKQLIEVRKGANKDIRIAVVRKMIEIIRAEVPGDFNWLSERATRSVTLSARPADNDALEAFMMQEFFPGGQPPPDHNPAQIPRRR